MNKFDRNVFRVSFYILISLSDMGNEDKILSIISCFRWRGIINKDGEGNTMCALYWQLNDVWAAPTWSTIDFDLSWKPAHYFARRFFDKTIISMVNFY